MPDWTITAAIWDPNTSYPNRVRVCVQALYDYAAGTTNKAQKFKLNSAGYTTDSAGVVRTWKFTVQVETEYSGAAGGQGWDGDAISSYLNHFDTGGWTPADVRLEVAWGSESKTIMPEQGPDEFTKMILSRAPYSRVMTYLPK